MKTHDLHPAELTDAFRRELEQAGWNEDEISQIAQASLWGVTLDRYPRAGEPGYLRSGFRIRAIDPVSHEPHETWIDEKSLLRRLNYHWKRQRIAERYPTQEGHDMAIDTLLLLIGLDIITKGMES